jgi:Domain of unknown function (DUF5668)
VHFLWSKIFHQIAHATKEQTMYRRRGSIVWPLILITLGVLFLLANFHVIPDVGEFISKFWPLILILIGLEILVGSILPGRRGDTQTLSLDLGSAPKADVKIDFGAGKLSIGAAATGKIVDGTYEGGVRYDASPDGRVRLRADSPNWWFFGWNWGWRGFNWQVGLTREVPLSLRLDVGAAESNLDLTDLKVTDLAIHTGASSTVANLPRAAGYTKVKVESGAASVRLRVPDGVAARIHTSRAIGSNDISPRFPRNGSEYVSPDYDTAANKIDIRFEGGVGSLAVN